MHSFDAIGVSAADIAKMAGSMLSQTGTVIANTRKPDSQPANAQLQALEATVKQQSRELEDRSRKQTYILGAAFGLGVVFLGILGIKVLKS